MVTFLNDTTYLFSIGFNSLSRSSYRRRFNALILHSSRCQLNIYIFGVHYLFFFDWADANRQRPFDYAFGFRCFEFLYNRMGLRLRRRHKQFWFANLFWLYFKKKKNINNNHPIVKRYWVIYVRAERCWPRVHWNILRFILKLITKTVWFVNMRNYSWDRFRKSKRLCA